MRGAWLPPGEVAGYRIKKRIGRGTMGEVWLAEDEALGREVAVKFPAVAEGPEGAEVRARMVLEGRALAKVRHPNLVAIHHAGELEDRPFLVTELLDGESLDKLERPIDPEHARAIVIDLLRGLAALHRTGILHRDLKPANAIRTSEGITKLIDFGLATEAPSLEAGGRIEGTPYYLAPELWKGSAPSVKTDLWALGALAFELARGTPPFEGRSMLDLSKLVTSSRAPRIGDQTLLGSAIDRCLEPDPASRPESAEDLLAMLEPAARSEAPVEEPYRGLASYREEDARIYFGREAELEAVLAQLRSSPVATIIAPSGEGKTSLVCAGVVPRMRAAGLSIEDGLGQPGVVRKGTLYVADRFEMLLDGDCTALDRRIVELVESGTAKLLIAVRSDAIGRFEALPRSRDDLLRRAIALRPLDLLKVIEAPLELAGFRFESRALAEELAAAGSLALASFLAARVWSLRDAASRTVPAGALASLGGIEGAVEEVAEAAIRGADVAKVRAVLGLLAGDGGQTVRVREEVLVGGDADRAAIVRRLIDARVAVTGADERGATVALSSALFVERWPRLRAWLDEDRVVRSIAARIARAAEDWERTGRAADALWNKKQLEELASLDLSALSPQDRAFVLESRRFERARLVRKVALRVGAVAAIALAIGGGALASASREAKERAAFIAPRIEAAQKLLDVAVKLDGEAIDARAEAIRGFEAANPAAGEAAFERALSIERGLGELYARASEELDRARARDPSSEELALRARSLEERWLAYAERNDDVTLAAELRARVKGDAAAAPAVLTVEVTPEEATVSPRGRNVLAPGSHVVEASAPGHAPVRAPIFLGAGEEISLKIILPPENAVPPGWIYIPAGASFIGSRASEAVRRAFESPPIHRVEVDAFLISRTESTFKEYLEFLRSLPNAERELRRPRGVGVDLSFRSDGRARLTLEGHSAAEGEPLCRPARRVRACQDWSKLPVVGVSFDDVSAFAAWLDRTGRVPGARICTAREWERAARGADRRLYPAGDRLAPGDANVEETYDRDPRAVGADEVGSYPLDASPFGVLDMAGNVFEYAIDPLAGPKPRVVLRGGAWDSSLFVASVSSAGPAPDERYESAGVRLCANTK